MVHIQKYGWLLPIFKSDHVVNMVGTVMISSFDKEKETLKNEIE